MTETLSVGAVEKEIEERGSFASVTKGVSMRPLFKTHRDMIVISRIEKPLKKYDVILYRGGGDEYILHRILKVKGDILIVRGDNNYFKEYVPKEKVIGVLTAFNRKGRSGSPDSTSFKIYSRLWRYIYPLRYLFAKTKRLLSRIKRKLIRAKKK